MKKRKSEDLIDSGNEWIGKIPRNWDLLKVKYIAKIDPDELSSSTDPFYQFNYVDIGSVNSFGKIESYQNLKFQDAPSRARKIVKRDDVIVSTVRTYLRAVARINGEKDPIICSTGFSVIRAQNIIPNFLFYAIISKGFIDSVEANSVGVSYPAIGSKDLSNFKIQYPPKPEQKAIATFLDHKTHAIDQLIEKKQQLIEKLKEKRQALITRAVTKGLNPNAPMKDSGVEWLGEIPEHWGVVRMRYLGKIDTGNKDTQDRVDEGEYPFFVRSDTIERLNSYSFDTEAVMTSGDGAGVCKIYHHFEGKFALHQRMYAIYDFKWVLGKYVYYSMKANFEKEVFKLSAKSTVESLRMPMLKNFPIVLNSINEQKRIVDYIESKSVIVDDSIEKIETQIGKLQEYRQSLISAAVTGKIDVRGEGIINSVNDENLRDAAMLVNYLIRELHRREIFYGRIMVVKGIIMLHYLLKLEMDGMNVKRYPRGPHDPDFQNRLENYLQSLGWIDIKTSDDGKEKITYTPRRHNKNQIEFTNRFGGQLDKVNQLIELFVQYGSKYSEELATTYSAWNDLLIWGVEPSEENILHQILSEWPGDEKKKVSKSEWKRAIKQLKKYGLEPTGYGQPTEAQRQIL